MLIRVLSVLTDYLMLAKKTLFFLSTKSLDTC